MKKNGFTLIELLAVIVILAILVLIATPAVTSLMTKSTTNSLKNEALGFVSDVDNAYTDKVGQILTVSTQTQIKNVKVGADSYSYLCMTLKDLVDEQYTKKNLGSTYYGYIQMWVPDKGGETITFVNMTNGRYYVQGRTSVLTGSYNPTQTAADDVATPSAASDFGCPAGTSIPDATVVNK